MTDQQHVVFLHGVGVGPSSWDAQLSALPDGFTGTAQPLPGLTARVNDTFTLERAAAEVIAGLDHRGIDRAHLCGLSLGAILALQIAINHPHRVASLILSGGQVRPPRLLMPIQIALMRVLPARLVAPDGTDRHRVIEVLKEVARVDFRSQIGSISVPTLVLCGSKDVANLPAARHLARDIPNARLRVMAGGGHELNTQKPGEFSHEMRQFLSALL